MHCASSNVSVTLANAPKLWKRGTQRHYGQECPVNGEWERAASSFLYRELVTWGKAFISSADVCLGFPVGPHSHLALQIPIVTPTTAWL